MTSYGRAICEAFEYLLASDPKVFAIGQGLWSPWYVGNSMSDLDAKFGRDRVIDTPVSELGTTGAALGAALCGYRPIVIHPRVDFMLLAVDQIVTQAAKWRSMFGGEANVPLTVRGIINRGGEQGAQHSQSLQSWFAHIPGLRVVMPANPLDARDLLIASVQCEDPVLYMDDRWLYEEEQSLPPISHSPLAEQGPRIVRKGADITLVGCGWTTKLCVDAASRLERDGIAAEVIDLRVLNPFDASAIIDSARRTRHVLAVDGDWKTCGMAGEVLASVAESRDGSHSSIRMARLAHPDAPAPTSKPLERGFYFDAATVAERARSMLGE